MSDDATRFQDLFASIDAMDVERFLTFLTDDVTFRFGSMPAADGREAVGAAVGGFFGSIAALSHDVQRCIVDANVAFCEGEVTYTRHDSSTITLPFVTVFELRDDLIAVYRIYIDIGPLYAT